MQTGERLSHFFKGVPENEFKAKIDELDEDSLRSMHRSMKRSKFAGGTSMATGPLGALPSAGLTLVSSAVGWQRRRVNSDRIRLIEDRLQEKGWKGHTMGFGDYMIPLTAAVVGVGIGVGVDAVFDAFSDPSAISSSGVILGSGGTDAVTPTSSSIPTGTSTAQQMITSDAYQGPIQPTLPTETVVPLPLEVPTPMPQMDPLGGIPAVDPTTSLDAGVFSDPTVVGEYGATDATVIGFEPGMTGPPTDALAPQPPSDPIYNTVDPYSAPAPLFQDPMYEPISTFEPTAPEGATAQTGPMNTATSLSDAPVAGSPAGYQLAQDATVGGIAVAAAAATHATSLHLCHSATEEGAKYIGRRQYTKYCEKTLDRHQAHQEPRASEKARAASESSPDCQGASPKLATGQDSGYASIHDMNSSQSPDNNMKDSRMGKDLSFSVQALFDFTAENDTEISIHKGEVINVVQTPTPSDVWWIGSKNGRRGCFPASFVQVLDVAIAMHSFRAESEDELGIHEGDLVEIISRCGDSSAWWLGRCREKVGVFPADYVRDL